MKWVVILVFLLGACGGMSEDELAELGKPLNRDEKVKLIDELEQLAASNVTDAVLVAWVKRLGRPVPLEIDEIIRLKDKNVGERVIRLMIKGFPQKAPLK